MTSGTTRLRLTKRAVDALAADGFHWDSEIRGFHVRVLATGRKVYGLQYRDRSGRQHRPKIGVHGQISAEQARDVARQWLVEIAAGQTPGAATGGGATVKALSGRYTIEHSDVNKKPTSRALDEIYWRVHILPVIGGLSVASLTPADIVKVIARLKEKPVTANRVRACLHKALNLAEEWKIRPRGTNPVAEVPKFKEPPAKHRYLSPAAMKKLGMAMTAYIASTDLAPPSGARMNVADRKRDENARAAAASRRRFIGLVMLLLITGARKREWMHGRWEWVHLETGEYRLPDSKTGAKTVLLSPHAVAILRELKSLAVKGNPYIFPGSAKGEPMKDERKQWKNLLKLAGLSDVRVHDLRHSFASAAKSSGFDRGIVADLLHHSDEAVTDIYADLFNDVVRQAQNKTAENIVGFLGVGK